MSIATDSLITKLLDCLDTDITHIGLGTGAGTITAASTLLSTETQRKAATITTDGTTLIIEGYWDDTEANGSTYTNAGCFGNSATGSVDTGTLYVGDNISTTKNSTESLTISIELTVEAVND